MNKRKSTPREKLIEDRIHLWKEHFKIGNSPYVIDKPIPKIINSLLEIQLGKFTEEELNLALKKFKSEKLLASTKYPRKYGRQKFDDFDFVTL